MRRVPVSLQFFNHKILAPAKSILIDQNLLSRGFNNSPRNFLKFFFNLNLWGRCHVWFYDTNYAEHFDNFVKVELDNWHYTLWSACRTTMALIEREQDPAHAAKRSLDSGELTSQPCFTMRPGLSVRHGLWCYDKPGTAEFPSLAVDIDKGHNCCCAASFIHYDHSLQLVKKVFWFYIVLGTGVFAPTLADYLPLLEESVVVHSCWPLSKKYFLYSAFITQTLIVLPY